MNAKRHFDEDDLASYAMNLLPGPEAVTVAAYLATSEEARVTLAAIESQLGVFALGSVEMRQPPPSSLDKLMKRLAAERLVPPETVQHPQSELTTSRNTLKNFPMNRSVSWAGWAVAAALAFTVAKFYHDHHAAAGPLISSQPAVIQEVGQIAAAERERQTLELQLSEQTTELRRLRVAIGLVTAEEKQLRGTNAERAKELATTTGELERQKASIADVEQSRDRSNATVIAQSKQLEELTQQAQSARVVLDALTEKSAMRVTLSEPAHQPSPSARTVYVASRGTLIFQGSHLQALNPGKVYQLWLLPADGSKPVPAGTFLPDTHGEATLVTPQLPNAVPAKGFGVTVETGEAATSPTLPILLLGISAD